MFKKGQLVRSRKYRDLYVVEHVYIDGEVVVVPLIVRLLPELWFNPERLELVGNNYKAK